MKSSEFVSTLTTYLSSGEFSGAASLLATAIGMTEGAASPEGDKERDCCARLREELKQARLERVAAVVKCNEEVRRALDAADGDRRDLEEARGNLRAAVDASVCLQEERDAAALRAEIAEKERDAAVSRLQEVLQKEPRRVTRAPAGVRATVWRVESETEVSHTLLLEGASEQTRKASLQDGFEVHTPLFTLEDASWLGAQRSFRAYLRSLSGITDSEALLAVLRRISFAPNSAGMSWSWSYERVYSKSGKAPEDAVNVEVSGWIISTSFQRPDAATGEVSTGRGRSWYVPVGISEDALVKTCFAACKMIVEHEIMEAFLFDGDRLFDPHHSVEDLRAAVRNRKGRK